MNRDSGEAARRPPFEYVDRYELRVGSTRKFWEIESSPLRLLIRWGRIGTSGQVLEKKFRWRSDLAEDRFKRIEQKEKEGYIHVGTREAPTPAGEELHAGGPIKAILAAPDAVDAYEAYGLWLQTKRSALGDFVAVETGLYRKPTDKKALLVEDHLLAEHESEWLGGLNRENGFEHAWRFGFVQRASIDGAGSVVHKRYTRFRRLEAARFVRDIALSASASYDQLIATLEGNGVPDSLNRLELATSISVPQRRGRLGSMRKLWPLLKRLEELVLKDVNLDLEGINVPALRSLRLHDVIVRPEAIDALAAARWPQLESLHLGLVGPPRVQLTESLGRLLSRVKMPALRSLQIRGGASAPLLEALQGGRILPNLRALDLFDCDRIREDVAAHNLLSNASSFAHLDRLAFDARFLDEGTRYQLRKALPRASFE
jgi:predicted DNA-binding WGR domain protein